MNQFLLATIPGILVALFSGLVTFWWSRNRFYSERWWERKADAYTLIIDALEHSVYAYYVLLEELEGITYPRPEQEKKEAAELSRKSFQQIKKAAAAGALFLSTGTIVTLRKLEKNVSNLSLTGDFHGYIEKGFELHKAALERIRSLAKKDLHVQ